MYVIRLEENREQHLPKGKRGYRGRDIASCDWNGETHTATTRHGATMALARVMVGKGAPDGPWEGVHAHTGRKLLHGASLHRLAKFTVQENFSDGPRMVPWVPFQGIGHALDDYEPAEGAADAP
jgi:hypothetical protein